jgi:hypothetical protein
MTDEYQPDPDDTLDPFGSPEGQEDEPDPDFFAQENEFYWNERGRREAGRSPAQLHRLTADVVFEVVDERAFAEWVVAHVDWSRTLELQYGGGDEGEDILYADFDRDSYSTADALEMARAACLEFKWAYPPGTDVQSSSWVCDRVSDERDRPQVCSLTVSMNVAVISVELFADWLSEVTGETAPSAVSAAEVLAFATSSVLPRLATAGVRLVRSEWSSTRLTGEMPETWD